MSTIEQFKLGDGVYIAKCVEQRGVIPKGTIILTTKDGNGADVNTIFLEPQTIYNLLNFLGTKGDYNK